MKNTYIDDVVKKVSERTHIKDQNLVRLYALLVLTKGEYISSEDVHDAWAMNMNFKQRTEFCYGHEHKSIVPFDELTEEVQNRDIKYVDILVEIAKEQDLNNSK